MISPVKFDYVLDTSVLILYLSNKKSSDKLSKFISSSAIPFLVLSELYYVIWRKTEKAKADEVFAFIKSWNLPILWPNERIVVNAGRYKAIYKLGLADSYIAAFAFDTEKPLITCDYDYRVLKKEIRIEEI